MKFKTKKILGVSITIDSREYILEEIWKYLEKCQLPNVKRQKKDIKPLVIFTPNPEIISYSQKDDKFRKLVNTAQINLPDSAGIVWAMKRIYSMNAERIAGVDFMSNLVKLAAKQRLTVGVIGGRGDLAVTTAECLRKKYPQLRIEAFSAPELDVASRKKKNLHTANCILLTAGENIVETEKYFANLAKNLIDKKVDILFVGLGFPKQEYFINNLQFSIFNFQFNRPLVLMAVGGAFDFLSGRVPRAPLWIRNIGLEWLFRLIREPWRLPRQLAGAEFFRRVLFS